MQASVDHEAMQMLVVVPRAQRCEEPLDEDARDCFPQPRPRYPCQDLGPRTELPQRLRQSLELMCPCLLRVGRCRGQLHDVWDQTDAAHVMASTTVQLSSDCCPSQIE